jgi:hypothetical protein
MVAVVGPNSEAPKYTFRGAVVVSLMDVAVILRSITGLVAVPCPIAGGYDVPTETTTLQNESEPTYVAVPVKLGTATLILPPAPSYTTSSTLGTARAELTMATIPKATANIFNFFIFSILSTAFFVIVRYLTTASRALDANPVPTPNGTV